MITRDPVNFGDKPDNSYLHCTSFVLPVSSSSLESSVQLSVSDSDASVVGQGVSASDGVEVQVSVQSSSVSQVKSVVNSGDDFIDSPSTVLSSNVSSSSSYIDFVTLHELVCASGQLNYVSCRLPVPSRLNVSCWQEYLRNYKVVL